MRGVSCVPGRPTWSPHALWYKQIHTYLGVIEALAGLPFDVRFMSFDEVIEGGMKALEDVDVVINAGAANTSFSGGQVWEDLRLQDALRRFVARGGGFIGIGQPTAVGRGRREMLIGRRNLPRKHLRTL